MTRSLVALACTSAVLALTACGGSDSDAETSGSPGGPDDNSWLINNQQTRYQDVSFSDAEIEAGLGLMEREVVIPGGEANGRDAADAQCWMVLDDDGMLRQFMWCGPLVNADGLDEWAPYPFASEEDGDGQLITYAPMLRDTVGTLTGEDSLRRPDGAQVPDSGKPGAVPQTVQRPTAGDCEVDGSITWQDVTLDLAQADYLDVDTAVEESGLGAADTATQFVVTHTIRFWVDTADAGHVVTLSSSGAAGGPYQPRLVSLNPYLQTRAQMESGASASQSLTASPNDGGTFEIEGVDGARVVATASRETFSGAETADIDLELTCR